MADAPAVLEMRQISKRFPGVVALDDMSLSIRKGDVHAIVGENGAGKSTLMKILSGAYPRDGGDILLNGELVDIRTPTDAIQKGIGVVYQDLPLVPTLTVLANIYLGREVSDRIGRIDDKALGARYRALCANSGIYVDPDRRIRDLSIAERQLVEILKILDRDAHLIVMDEPTAALDENSKQALFETVRKLKAQGKAFVLITHFIDEVFEAADRVTVLKDGRHVATLDIDKTTPDEVVGLMIGHSPRDMFPPRSATSLPGKPVLEARNLCIDDVVRDVSLTLHEGEIVGLTGLVGSGGSEIARALIGDLPIDSGTLLLDGKPVSIDAPYGAMEMGICLLPNDRKRLGLVADFEVYKNISLSALYKFSRGLVTDVSAEEKNARNYIDQLRIVTPSPRQRVSNLSGGNQQKVIISRILSTDARVIILDEPTQGIDVHAKEEIFSLIRKLADQGKAILFISSEFKEISGVADRSIVLSGGAVVADFAWQEASEAILIKAAITGNSKVGR